MTRVVSDINCEINGRRALLTRPVGASEKLAGRLVGLGIKCFIDPLLTIVPTRAAVPIGDFDAIIFTSLNAVRCVFSGYLGDKIRIPCFCVGDVTAHAARSAGFLDVRGGARNGRELADVVCSCGNGIRRVLHISGESVSLDMARSLAAVGVSVERWVVYTAVPAQDFSQETVNAFDKNEIWAAPVFSVRSAQTLVALIEKNRLEAACSSVVAIGLSQAVSNVLESMEWKELRTAEFPTEDAMISSLVKER